MTTPGTGSLFRSDLYEIHHIFQNSLMAYPKELIIGMLREEFSKDSFYHYVSDPWGFPKVPDHTDLPLGAGLNDDLTTRIFIGEAFRFDAIFYPALLVKMTAARSVPISMNRNKDVVEYEKQLVIDGYGNSKEFFIPKYIDLAGAWEGTIAIDVISRDILDRDNLVSIVMLLFTDIRFESLRKAGVLVKSGQPSLGGISEGDDRQQDKLYKATISVDIRTEWRRLIPISDVVERINFCVDFRVWGSEVITNPNIAIGASISILDQIEAL
ncbi:hypothetical protein M0R72_02370 [Candidatus Pacearchaeota archaeon]|nr:hypothetical protein [Candidatus Pacearchaeota archaeon]